MKIIHYLKKRFYKIKFKSECNRKPWLFATSIGFIPFITELILGDYFFLLSGILALGFWFVLSILFLFEYCQSSDK